MFSLKALNAYTWVTNYLKTKNISYVIIGGVAAYLYGSPRPVADIDIGIPDQYLRSIYEDLNEYVVENYLDGYVDECWRLKLLILKYHGQLIDIFGFDSIQIFNSKANNWSPINCEAVSNITIDKQVFPVIDVEELRRYKAILGREVDKEDLKYI